MTSVACTTREAIIITTLGHSVTVYSGRPLASGPEVTAADFDHLSYAAIDALGPFAASTDAALWVLDFMRTFAL